MRSTARPHGDDLAADLLADMATTLPGMPPATPGGVQPAAPVEDGGQPGGGAAVQTTVDLSPRAWRRPALRVGRAGLSGAVGPVRVELRLRKG